MQGECAERCAEAHGFSREAQEEAALESFRRATEAAESGVTAQVCTALLAGVPGADWVVQEAYAAGGIVSMHMEGPRLQTGNSRLSFSVQCEDLSC
jgi:acetyl-CoA acetyltransferase